MKIAVPTRDGRVDDHFGHCAYYTIFEVIDGNVTGVSKMASPEGCGCKSGIAPVLRQMGVTVMLARNHHLSADSNKQGDQSCRSRCKSHKCGGSV